MSTNRITAAVRAAAVTALIGLPALGFAGAAVAHPGGVHPPAVDPIVGSEGGPCSENRVGVDGDTGNQLACVHSPDGGVWTGTNGAINGVHDFGSPCDSSVEDRSQTRDGRVITCTPGENVWEYGA
ncbi:hypothetical protein [Rhodococcus maanshanensis]|uniref:Secreted protein n=1 Tax=Rhodococcus maanshanensis TaxID=183556 RepID=A0A1H7RDF4_9NOCA|nr:hypothetical protein [Rhodococcus maanshanensis]SEL58035.1 hypothetical protein SAMN05444583_11145 [Rhodococcus maanshanensis]